MDRESAGQTSPAVDPDAEPRMEPRVAAVGARVFIAPVKPLDRPPVRLFLTSLVILFVELLLIRWIPSNLVFVSYFTNFILIGSFLGIGVGILLGRNGWVPRVPIFALLLLAVVVVVATSQLTLTFDSGSDIYFGLTELSRDAGPNYLVLPLVVALTAAVMAAVSLPLGPLLRAMPPLRAYSIDIVGSMVGIALFSGLSAFGLGPFAWFAVLGVILTAAALGRGVTAWSAVSVACFVVILGHTAGLTDTWSPYQRLTVLRTPDAVGIYANGVPHQGFFLDPSREPYPFYTQLDRWFPGRSFDRVLVIGSGAGNDTAAALARGARHVDAVEIDPAILGIGRDLNPARPYSDPRVATHVQDGRAFLRSADGEYDLVVYAVTDSLALVSNTANLRLESFLFTREAFDEVRDHLAPGGVFVLYNLYRERWLVEKLAAMLDATFEAPPLVRLFPSESGAAAVLAAGPAVQALAGGPPPGDQVDDITSTDQLAPATDDWPFLYLREPTVAPFYLGALLIVLLLAVVAVVGSARARNIPLRRFSPHFFVLGIAFLLLETRSLATFSLLFGTTWVVNALAFFGILASVLAAIGVTAWLKPRRSGWIYIALGLSLVVGYLVPPESLLIDPPWLRYLAASLLAFAPIFFANLAFTFSFRDTVSADMAFASNLLGAVVGGCLEYLALVTGYQALLIVVLALYGCAFLLATRFRTLADRELVDDAGSELRVAAAAASPSS